MIPIEDTDIYNTASLIITFAVGFGTKHYADMYAAGKKKISKIHKLLDTVDAALQDDKVTDEEFNQIFTDTMELIKA